MVEGCMSIFVALDVLGNPGDTGCAASVPLQPRPCLSGRVTSKSLREQSCRTGQGYPTTSPDVASRSLAAYAQVESCSPAGVAHPKGSLPAEKSQLDA